MAVALVGTAFIMTFSRSTLILAGSIVLVSGFVVMMMRGSVSGRQVLIVVATLVLVFAVCNVALLSLNLVSLWDFAGLQYASLFDSQNYSNWQATASLTVAFKAFLDHPLLGVGVGNLSFYVDQYIPAWSLVGRSLTQYTIPAIANNIYVEVAAEMGILGLIALAYLIVHFMRGGFLAARSCKSYRWRVLVVGLVSSYLVMLVAFTMLSAFFFAYVWALTALLHNVVCEIMAKDSSYRSGSSRASDSLAVPLESYARLQGS